MVATFNCPPGTEMNWENEGSYVHVEEYNKLRDSLRACVESMGVWAYSANMGLRDIEQVAQDAFTLLEES
jgi:hypothetical protein